MDPLAPEYPFYSSYQFAGNQVVWAIDIEGLEPYIVTHRSFAPWNKFGNFKEKDVFTNNIKTFHVNKIKKGWFLWKKTIGKIYVYNEKSYTIQEWNNMMGYKKAAPDLEQNEGIGGKQCLK